jgi:Fic family protein
LPNHVETSTGEMFYFASPEETPAKMNDLLKWYKDETEQGESHPLILASLFHYRFVRIHPFDDGNGRMSRLLMNLILMKHGYPPVIIETSLKNHYLDALQYADAEDYDKFIIFIGERMLESLEMWLRAAKGEAIEEDEDIYELVSSLKRKMQKKENIK